ncbi:MAG TPA: iron-containing alcohol dehydrogenase [Candidatus Limnocylindrales bacterium]|jgi:glycerol dehydrogenase-like iron-containing ADH family enzyme
MDDSFGFTTVFGRELVGELPAIAHPPYLVVTMDDLWPSFEERLRGSLAGVHLVRSLDVDQLEDALAVLPPAESIIGLGGGQALDVAKFIAWRRRLPLFQVPTALTVNAAFGHKSGVRTDAGVRYVGWVVPETVYIDFDVIQAAPAWLNRSGVGDVLCYHTAHLDWRLARDRGRTERRWPYDERLVAEARRPLEQVLSALDDIREVNETGIRVLAAAHRWGGAAFHAAGWNPRHIEGIDHFLYYNLERLTGHHFIHGQPVGLGIVVGSLLHDEGTDEMLRALHRAGVDIRPEAMGITWDDVAEAVRTLPAFVRQANLWFTVADVATVDDSVTEQLRERIDAVYGTWGGGQ